MVFDGLPILRMCENRPKIAVLTSYVHVFTVYSQNTTNPISEAIKKILLASRYCLPWLRVCHIHLPISNLLIATSLHSSSSSASYWKPFSIFPILYLFISFHPDIVIDHSKKRRRRTSNVQSRPKWGARKNNVDWNYFGIFCRYLVQSDNKLVYYQNSKGWKTENAAEIRSADWVVWSMTSCNDGTKNHRQTKIHITELRMTMGEF